MVVDQNPNPIWNIVPEHLPFRVVGAMVIGSIAGGVSLSSIYFAQVAFHSNEEHRSFWGLLFIGAALGAFVGYMGSKYRKRNCPKCGLSMGASQHIRVGGWERASQANQLNLREWVVRTRTQRGKFYNRPCIEPFYLCRGCDLEFRLADLRQREATQKEVDVTGS